jgi:hypothetical protein
MAKSPRLPRGKRKDTIPSNIVGKKIRKEGKRLRDKIKKQFSSEGAPNPAKLAALRIQKEQRQEKDRNAIYSQASMLDMDPEAQQEHSGSSMSTHSPAVVEASEQLVRGAAKDPEADISAVTPQDIQDLYEEFPELNPSVRWHYEPQNYELAPGEEDNGNGMQIHEYEIIMTDGRSIKGKANYYGKHKSLISVILGINRDIDTGDMEEIVVGDYEYVFD